MESPCAHTTIFLCTARHPSPPPSSPRTFAPSAPLRYLFLLFRTFNPAVHPFQKRARIRIVAPITNSFSIACTHSFPSPF
jgi:hypothetical protein